MSTTAIPSAAQKRAKLISPQDVSRDAAITRDRYTSPEFMRLEAEYVWPFVWNIGGRATEIPEPGDYIVHELANDSIIMVRQADGSVKAHHNVCPHRGNRLLSNEGGAVEAFTCAYHGWKYDLDGELVEVQDPDDFPRGNPCGKLHLTPVQCEVWGGFVWYNMDLDAAPLATFLGEVKDILEAYRVDQMTRVLYRVAEVPCNYKCIHDNFCESYHLPATHPQLADFFDDDYRNTEFYEFSTGHNLMKMKGALPSKRGDRPDEINPVLAEEMTYWGLDPAEFEGRAHEVREALQKQKRKLGPEKGFEHFKDLTDDQYTDRYHFNLFPGTTVTMSPVSLGFQRAEPHPTDPNKCIYEQWQLVSGPDKDGMCYTSLGMVPFEDAEKEIVTYGEKSLGLVVDQDLNAAEAQQRGFKSRGFQGAYLTGQESRIQQFHNTLDAYIEAGKQRTRG